MSIILKTIYEDGHGTEAKIIWADRQDEFKALVHFLTDAAGFVKAPDCMIDLMQALHIMRAEEEAKDFNKKGSL